MTMTAPARGEQLQDVLEVVTAHADRADENGDFPAEALDALRRSGLLGLLVPAEYGGGGGSLQDMLTVSGLALPRVHVGRPDLRDALSAGGHDRPLCGG